MKLEHVSVESRKKFRQSYLPGFEESTIFSPPIPKAEPDGKTKGYVQINIPEISRILKKFIDKSLCGYEYVRGKINRGTCRCRSFHRVPKVSQTN